MQATVRVGFRDGRTRTIRAGSAAAVVAVAVAACLCDHLLYGF